MAHHSPHLQFAKELWQKHLKVGDLSIDATCGNGQDALFLSQFGPVVCLDIQLAAICHTAKLVPGALLFQVSHTEIDSIPLPVPPKLIVYNLGYLPKGDKTITTKTESTLLSVKKSLNLLASNGAVSIMCYPGHEEGEKEERALLDFVQTLPSSEWLISHHRWINRPKAPSLIWVRSAS